MAIGCTGAVNRESGNRFEHLGHRHIDDRVSPAVVYEVIVPRGRANQIAGRFLENDLPSAQYVSNSGWVFEVIPRNESVTRNHLKDPTRIRQIFWSQRKSVSRNRQMSRVWSWGEGGGERKTPEGWL